MKKKKHPLGRAGCAALALAVAGCGGRAGATIAPVATAAASSTPATGNSAYSCPSASTSSGTLDCTTLPLGDLKSSSSARQGYIFVCQSQSGTPPVSSAPWLNGTTWNALTKIVVEGSVGWNGAFSQSLSTDGSVRTVSSNALPISPYVTGTFPIAASDPAYAYDHNPNSIAAHADTYVLPANPAIAATPSCLSGGTIAITLTGVHVYDAFDATDHDAVAREEQDACHGHPDQSDTYHYHGFIQTCVPDAGSATQNSSLLGYALDGFGIYGPWYGGKILTTADLDACHGTTSAVMWNGQLTTIYHYVSTYDFPYTLGCYRGTPVTSS